VTAYCRLAAKDCELAAGPLTEAAAAALGGTFLHTEVVDKGLQLAVSLTKMLAMAGTAVAESVQPRDAREYLMRRAVFEHAHAAMAGAGAALAELAAVIPAERSPALAHAAPVAEFLRDKAAADFKNKHELVRCSVGMMDLVLQPVVRLVRRAHTAELGVCSMVNELTMPKREMDSSHCWGYLEGE
ncbi:MAG: hypothetical protein ACK41V_23830, partial [Acidovorax sp.]|uniref:hypothetical protein n=1 Tax=Acidovorax sp. TaxID=1872122 RepID=UPI00391B683B